MTQKKDKNVRHQAMSFVKANKNLLVEKFASPKRFKPFGEAQPASFFMAGSPGAGKTEFSESFLKDNRIHAIRIDADEIRNMIPLYTGKNSADLQPAASRGVHILFDYAIKNNISFLLDGTFAYEDARRNVIRSLNRGRYVEIFYIYQDPLLAWEFTQEREKTEGRKVSKQIFVQVFFKAKENVQKVKNEFGDQIKLNVFVKNYYRKKILKFEDVQSLEPHVAIPYNENDLFQKLL